MKQLQHSVTYANDSITMNDKKSLKITLIGAGTIGLSFAAFHLIDTDTSVTIYDTRPDARSYIEKGLLQFLPTTSSSFNYHVAATLEEAVSDADIIQESGPENLSFKKSLWKEIEQHVPKTALLWSSTSGIPASEQAADMQDQSRVIVVHPYNPPHIMPLLELIPSRTTSPDVIKRTQDFWHERGRVPIHIKKEVTGFVANRLAFALLREAVHLVNEGVVSVSELDSIVESSMGPRWAVAGPFKSYHAGGGSTGLEGFFKNIGGTVQACWSDAGTPNVGDGWEEKIFKQAEETYGRVDVRERDRITRKVLQAVKEGKEEGEVR